MWSCHNSKVSVVNRSLEDKTDNYNMLQWHGDHWMCLLERVFYSQMKDNGAKWCGIHGSHLQMATKIDAELDIGSPHMHVKLNHHWVITIRLQMSAKELISAHTAYSLTVRDQTCNARKSPHYKSSTKCSTELHAHSLNRFHYFAQTKCYSNKAWATYPTNTGMLHPL